MQERRGRRGGWSSGGPKTCHCFTNISADSVHTHTHTHAAKAGGSDSELRPSVTGREQTSLAADFILQHFDELKPCFLWSDLSARWVYFRGSHTRVEPRKISTVTS